jgi:hypothetical protein
MGIETQINTIKCGKGFLCGLDYCPHILVVRALITLALVIRFQLDDHFIFLDSFLWFKLLPSHFWVWALIIFALVTCFQHNGWPILLNVITHVETNISLF